MHAFEELIAEILEANGYWVRHSFKVALTREDKLRIGRPSSPRWVIDILAYRAPISRTDGASSSSSAYVAERLRIRYRTGAKSR